MTYLQSKAGEIKHILEWQYDLNDFWSDIHRDKQDKLKFPKPANAWERFTKLLGLVEVDHENNSNGGLYNGVF